jgi:hypothetical protein
MPGLHAFTDEYGDSSLATEKSGVTTFFIITAVLVDDEQVTQQRLTAHDIRSRYFGPGEMKSSSVGTDDARRRELLQELSALRMSTYTLAVDKRELDQEGGLAWRKSFFKFLNRRLFERIYKLLDNVKLVADEHGREKFMKGFVAYVDRTLPLTLFTRRQFGFAKSSEEVMLQVADVVSGSWARVLDPQKRSPMAPEFVALLERRSVGLEAWPPRLQPEITPARHADAAKDELIRRHCVRQAQLFLREHQRETSDEDQKAQIEILTMLLFNVQFGDAARYVAAGKVIDRLHERLGLSLSQRRLRTVISGLRDAGVVIGTSRRGYKIPVCEADIKEYVNHANVIVPPMLARLRRARDDIKLASLGAIDILDASEFAELRRLVETGSGGGAA